VGRLEEERGKIGISEYVQLAIAQEQGTAEETAGTLEIPRGAIMRLERVWIGRFARDALLRQQVEWELERAYRS
jgi:hypothetical protein